MHGQQNIKSIPLFIIRSIVVTSVEAQPIVIEVTQIFDVNEVLLSSAKGFVQFHLEETCNVVIGSIDNLQFLESGQRYHRGTSDDIHVVIVQRDSTGICCGVHSYLHLTVKCKVSVVEVRNQSNGVVGRQYGDRQSVFCTLRDRRSYRSQWTTQQHGNWKQDSDHGRRDSETAKLNKTYPCKMTAFPQVSFSQPTSGRPISCGLVRHPDWPKSGIKFSHQIAIFRIITIGHITPCAI